jgi:hypothetical protein
MTSRSEVACRATWLASRVVPRLVAKPSSTPISESQGRLAASSPGRGGVCAGVNGVGELVRAVTRKMQCSGRSGARFDHGGGDIRELPHAHFRTEFCLRGQGGRGFLALHDLRIRIISGIAAMAAGYAPTQKMG